MLARATTDVGSTGFTHEWCQVLTTTSAETCNQINHLIFFYGIIVVLFIIICRLLILEPDLLPSLDFVTRCLRHWRPGMLLERSARPCRGRELSQCTALHALFQ